MNYTNDITKLNANDIPMTDTHYYAFMADGRYIDNRLDCHIAYLTRFGFIKGKDKINSDALRSLDYIHYQYFYDHVMPTINELGVINE